MKLICENIDQGIEYFTESANGKKNTYIRGIFMQAEKKNRNGRIYPKNVMEQAVKKYTKEQIARGRSVGELNHPDGPTINLDRVSHLITELTWEGNNVIGKAKLLDTPQGQIAKGLINGGVQLGVSSRGMGSLVTKNGVNMVGEDFMLNTVDIVQDPSADEAFVEGIMEGVDWVYDSLSNSWIRQEMLEDTVKKHKQANTFNESKAIKEFKDLLFMTLV